MYNMKKDLRILAICGSLRPNSSNHCIVNAIKLMAPEDVDITTFDELREIPAFDDSVDHPAAVLRFRKQLQDADGIIICTPEYAFGIPGALKNAIDWTVGTGELVNKPVALVTASSGGQHAHAGMLLVLKALSANIPGELSALISHVRSKLDAKGNISDAATVVVLRSVLDSLIIKIKEAIHDKENVSSDG